MWEQQLKSFFKLIEWFTYLGLLIASVLFVQDAWTNYKKKDIGVKINKVRPASLTLVIEFSARNCVNGTICGEKKLR